jgi:hypothetical protein
MAAMVDSETVVAAGSTAVRGSTGGFWVRISAAPMASTAMPKTTTAAQSGLLVVLEAVLKGMFIETPD